MVLRIRRRQWISVIGVEMCRMMKAEIFVVPPRIVVLDPILHGSITMKDKGDTLTLIVTVEMCDTVRLEDDAVAMPHSNDNAWLNQDELASGTVSKLEDETYVLVLEVAVDEGGDIEIDDEASERMGRDRIAKRKYLDHLLKSIKRIRK